MAQLVLRRKLRRSAQEPSARAAPWARSLPKVWARTIHRLSGMTAEAKSFSERALSFAEALELLPDPGFWALLASPRDPEEPLGLVTLDSAGLSATVQALSAGSFALVGDTSDDRLPTQTDFILVAELIEAILAELAPPSAEQGDTLTRRTQSPDHLHDSDPRLFLPEGWRLLRLVHDIRLLPALLHEGCYRFAELRFSLEHLGARREGRLQLIWPETPPRRTPLARYAGEAAGFENASARGEAQANRAVLSGKAPLGGAAAPEAPAFAPAVQNLTAVLDAVLGRVQMPLERALALAPGDALELPLSALEDVSLVGLDGVCYARARLGQARGVRAVRILAIAPGDGARTALAEEQAHS